MRLSVKYTELAAEICKRTGHTVEFEFISNDTVKILKPFTIPLLGSTKIGLDIKVIGFKGTNLEVKAASDVLSKILALLPSFDISKYAVIEKDVVTIQLGKIEQLKKPMNYVRPTLLSFDEKTIHLDVVTL